MDLVRWGLLDSKIEDMKKAMLYLLDGTHTIQIFDKTYEPTDFPVKVYYRYDKEGEFIDLVLQPISIVTWPIIPIRKFIQKRIGSPFLLEFGRR